MSLFKFKTLGNQTYDLNIGQWFKSSLPTSQGSLPECISKPLKGQKSVSISQAISLVLELRPPNRRLSQGKQISKTKTIF